MTDAQAADLRDQWEYRGCTIRKIPKSYLSEVPLAPDRFRAHVRNVRGQISVVGLREKIESKLDGVLDQRL